MGENILDTYKKEIMIALVKHIEEFACAYAKHTSLPPDKIVMNIQYTPDGTKLWFTEKKDVNEYII